MALLTLAFAIRFLEVRAATMVIEIINKTTETSIKENAFLSLTLLLIMTYEQSNPFIIRLLCNENSNY